VSIVISVGAPGKHTPAAAELRTRQLIAANEDLVCELTSSIIRGCQAETRAAELEAENKALKARVRELGDKVIRAGAEHQRLRQAVINARPKIREVPTDLVRPYSPVVVLPYTSPVDHPTA
jgi:hypothetical protein